MDASDRRRRAAEEAAEWWVLLQGDVPRGEREKYVDWLRESALHVAEMLRVAQVHGALAQFAGWSEIPTDGSDDAPGTVIALPALERGADSSRGSALGPRLRLVGSLAAVLLLAAGISAWVLFGFRGQTIQTERGERREVALADGSVVQVDPETRLRVRYQEDRRLVVLERGRALFHVAKNAARPFLVETDRTTVRAVGTAFAVERQSGEVVVTVAEGRVAVLAIPAAATGVKSAPPYGGTLQQPLAGTPQQSLSSARPQGRSETFASPPTAVPECTRSPRVDSPRAGSGEIILCSNQQLTVQASGTAEPVREVDSQRSLAWAEGRLVFDNDSVEHVVQEFNRYNRIQLSVQDPVLARRSVSGTFNAADPESFVAFIETVAPVRVTRSESGDVSLEAPK